LTYTGLGDSGTFTFDTQGSGTPTVNGVPVDYAPDYTFQSPFMNEDWASGVVTIEKDGREMYYDFNKVLSGPCDETVARQKGDTNYDCKVNLIDFAAMAKNWLIDVSLSR
jgi:hypothetical protein